MKPRLRQLAYSGTWSGGVNQMAKRDRAIWYRRRDPPGWNRYLQPVGLFVPLNRRIVYNRASVYQTGSNEGIPLAPEKWVVKWVWDAANAKGGYYQAGGDVVDGYALDRPSAFRRSSCGMTA